MKQNYRLLLVPRAESEQTQSIRFNGTLWQANNAFQALRVALHNSEVKKIVLLLVGKDDSQYQLNSVECKGAENGL